MEKKRIEVFCRVEQVKIGDLELRTGRVRVTAMVFARGFVPVEPKYMYAPGSCKDGQFAKCPNCKSLVELHPTEVKGKVKVDPEIREAAVTRARHIADQAEYQGVQHGVDRHIDNKDDGSVALQFGSTTMEIE